MASIVPSKLHPDEEVSYSLAGGEFTLGPGGSYETDDQALILNAISHPWLSVEADPATAIVVDDRARHVDPKLDVLAAAHGTEAFDSEKIVALEASKVRSVAAPVAIQAGLNQDKKVIEAGVAHTLAAEPVVVERADKATDKARTAVEKKGDN